MLDVEIRASAVAPLSRSGALAGSWAALIAAFGVAGFGVAQVLQLIGATQPPLDAILIYAGSLIIAPPFLVAMIALHYATPAHRRFWSHTALAFATIYAMFAVLMYVGQLASIVPAKVSGADVPVLLTDAPHALFWTIDALAYIAMGCAAAFALGAIVRRREPVAWWFALAHAVMTPVIAVVYFAPTFSVVLLLLATPWLVTALGLTLSLAGLLRRAA